MSLERHARMARIFFIACLAVGLVVAAWALGNHLRAQQQPPPASAAESPRPAEPGASPPAVETPTPAEAAIPAESPPPAAGPAAPGGQTRDFDPRDDIRRSSGLYGEITHVGLRRFLVLITAFVIGTAGAAAFHLGVYAGFIARESRPGLLEFLHTEFMNRTTVSAREKQVARLLRTAFWCFGGIVAVVFQAADADSLVPIQAFVLGASWPTVVTQLMSGRNSPPPPQWANIIPATPPGPTPGGPQGTAPQGAGTGGGRAVEVIG
jgi:hypothetical protein